MTTEPTPSPNAARIERTYDAPAELIWELLTTRQHRAHRGNELDHLGAAIRRRTL